MSFIDKLNRFASNPVNMNMKRSKFNLSHGHKLTMVAGKLVPLMCTEILPDDTMKLNVASLIRSITPALPVMDNAYFDIFAFWVPSRLATVHEKDWQKIHGENDSGFWADPVESTLINTGNTFKFSDSTKPVQAQSLADYLGIPISFYHSDMELSRLPFNAFLLIWNEWFRDQNTQAPIQFKSFTNAQCISYFGDPANLPDVNKFHDYFTSALPSPQKGASVLLPMAGQAPVITGNVHTGYQTAGAVRFVDNSGGDFPAWSVKNIVAYNNTGQTRMEGTLGYDPGSTASASAGGMKSLLPSNLWADLTNATAVSVNEMRQAFAIQKLFEKDARGGTRYRETLMTHFGVSIPDNTVQVPEYVGGKRVPLNQMQVLQTSENGTSPLGTTGAFSNTSDSSDICVKSFAEHGYLIVCGCIRVNQSYSQGISRMFTRYRRFDNYYPVFANLDNQKPQLNH